MDGVTVLRVKRGTLSVNQEISVPGAASVAVGNNHLYVATGKSAKSYSINDDDQIGAEDGSVTLALANGSTAQIGAGEDFLYVTEKGSDAVGAGLVDHIALKGNGAIDSKAAVTTIATPAGSLTPFGFQMFNEDTAVITLAHSSQLGVYRDNQLLGVFNFPEVADCWMARGKKGTFYTGNTGSGNVTFGQLKDEQIIILDPVAATTVGGTTDVALGGHGFVAISGGHNIAGWSINPDGSLNSLFSIAAAAPLNGAFVIPDGGKD